MIFNVKIFLFITSHGLQNKLVCFLEMLLNLYSKGHSMPNEQIIFKLHQMFYILMKFGTFVNLTKIIRMQKNFF